jgi:hypothetical protein
MSSEKILMFAVMFVGDPVMGIWGFLMFRYPETWAKINARFSHKRFDSPKQLASTRRLGIFLMTLAAFSFVSMLYAVNALALLK